MTSASLWVASLPHARARALALPAIASNVAIPVVGLIDTAMLGHFSDAPGLGAVGLGSAVVATVFWAFAFLRPGTTSLVGRALGAGFADDAVAHLRRALALALGMGVAWVALQWLVVPPLVGVLAHDATAGPLAVDYALIRGLSLPAVLVTLAIVGYLIGAQDTRTPLAIAGAIGGVNAVATLVAVGMLGMGARGAGWSTFAAEWVGAGLALMLLRRKLGATRWRSLWDLRDASFLTGWRGLASMNAYLVGRSALLMGAITVVASIGSRWGDEALAANAIALQMMYLASYALDGYATAGETMAAREIGARDVPALHKAAAASSLAGLAIALGLSVVFLVGRDPILATLTDLPGVLEATSATWWAVAAIPLVSGAAWMLDGIFLGAGRARDMLASMAVSVLGVFGVIVGVALATGHFTNAVLWAAFLAMNVTRALTLGWRYASLTSRQRWILPAQASAAL